MRIGRGKGLGQGYRNLMPQDHHVHSMSARGVATQPCGLKPVNLTNATFTRKALELGTSVELEHTTDRLVAEKIAIRHLLENPNYYKFYDPKDKKADEYLITVHDLNAMSKEESQEKKRNKFLFKVWNRHFQMYKAKGYNDQKAGELADHVIKPMLNAKATMTPDEEYLLGKVKEGKDFKLGKYKIEFVKPSELGDFAAMNPCAAREMHFKPHLAKNEIIVDKSMSDHQNAQNIAHEVKEATLMKNGEHYWSAHRKALKYEKNPKNLLKLASS